MLELGWIISSLNVLMINNAWAIDLHIVGYCQDTQCLTIFYEEILYAGVTWIKGHSKVWLYTAGLETDLLAKGKWCYWILTESLKQEKQSDQQEFQS